MKKLILILVFLFITVPVFSALEDFETYTEVDANGDVTISSDTITVSSLATRNSVTYVYKDFTAIDGFEITGKFYTVAMDDWSGELTIFALATAVGDQANYGTHCSLRLKTTNTELRIQSEPGSDLYVGAKETAYWFTCDRGLTVADKCTCKIYTGGKESTLVDTLTSNTVSDEFRYLYALAAYDTNDGTRNWNGTTEDFEIEQTFAIVTGRSRRFMMMHED